MNKIPVPDHAPAYRAAGQSVAAYFLGLDVEARSPRATGTGPYTQTAGSQATVIGPYARATGSQAKGILPAGGLFAIHEDQWEHLAVAALASVIAEAKYCGQRLEVRDAITTAIHTFPADKIKHLPLTRLYYEAEALVEYRWSDIEAVALRLLQGGAE